MKTRASSPPKLSIDKLPPRRYQATPQGLLTPPLHAMGTVPFDWEEAPGKPRASLLMMNTSSSAMHTKPKSVRCLKLVPPTKLFEGRESGESPTSIIDGPDQCWSPKFGIVDESRQHELDGIGSKEIGQLGSRSKSISSSSCASGRTETGSSDASNWEVKVKITRFRRKRRGSLYNLSQTSAQIMESFKRLLQWRRGQEKLRTTTP